MTDDPLQPVERWLTQALTNLEPARRQVLLREIGRELRRRNQRRMSRQVGPDGTKWEPRKRDRSGKIRKKKAMMLKLREDRRLALSATPDGMEMGYTGRDGRIAEVHHLGEVDEVERGGAKVKYPARPLLGLHPDDLAFVRERLMAAIGG